MLMTANMSIIVHRPPLIGAWIIVRWISSYRAHTWPFSYPDERLVAKFQRNFTSCNTYIPRNKRKKWESERKKEIIKYFVLIHKTFAGRAADASSMSRDLLATEFQPWNLILYLFSWSIRLPDSRVVFRKYSPAFFFSFFLFYLFIFSFFLGWWIGD